LLNDDRLVKTLFVLARENQPSIIFIDEVDAFYADFYLDKKSHQGAITFVLPGGYIGIHTLRRDIDATAVKSALKHFEGAS